MNFDNIHQSFMSESVTENKSRSTTKVSFYSSEGRDALERFIDYNYPAGHGAYGNEGYVDSVTYRQDGPIWYADVVIWKEYALSIGIGRRAPLNHTLRAVSIPMPLQKKQGYRAKWDHYFWQRIPVVQPETSSGTAVSGSTASESSGSSDAVFPPEYDTVSSDAPFESSGIYYRWTRDGTELDGTPKSGFVWKNIAPPTKPGVEHWDRHTYQITEYGEYHDERSATWVCDNVLDRYRSTPLLGDFGLSEKLNGSGWNWKCDDAVVEYNGKRWVATLVWTLSGDNNGWDQDLYDAAPAANGNGNPIETNTLLS